MGIYFKDVKKIIHEMIQQAMLGYDQGYVHHMRDLLIHNCMCTHTTAANFTYVSLNFCCLCLSDVYLIISILTGNANNNR